MLTTETGWDKAHDWSTAIDVYKQFKWDRQGRNVDGSCPLHKKWGCCFSVTALCNAQFKSLQMKN